jgi:hypothetical protein
MPTKKFMKNVQQWKYFVHYILLSNSCLKYILTSKNISAAVNLILCFGDYKL